MFKFSRTADAIGATASKLEKTRVLAEYLRELEPADLRLAAVWMTGRAFSPNDPRVLNLGGSTMWRAVQALSRLEPDELGSTYLKYSDPGDWAFEVLQGRTQPRPTGLQAVAQAFDRIAATGSQQAKLDELTLLLDRLQPLEAKYVVKILTSDLRIGLQEGLVEEAVAQAFGLKLDQVRRLHMLTGDIGETAVRCQGGEVDTTTIQLFKPVRFMLATAVATPQEAMERVGSEARGVRRERPPGATPQGGNPPSIWTEEKYDGVRCQLHKQGDRVALYSRDLRETTLAFPELAEAAGRLAHDVLVDGEVLGHRGGKVLRFFELQRRLGRKEVPASLRQEVPVALVAFDLLYLDGEAILDLPLRERRARLEGLGFEHPFLLARYETARSASDLDRLFKETRERGNEGLMLKSPESAYTPGRRGMAWLKLKRPLATLDVVVTAVEWGHGKRRGVLSDYTFAVLHEETGELVNVGKAYTGLTDAEIAAMTQHFLLSTLVDRGRVRIVRPETVLEVAFDSIQHSGRHKSGYALRFPRIVRLRPDKSVQEIDTLATVAALYERFFGAESETTLEEIAETPE